MRVSKLMASTSEVLVHVPGEGTEEDQYVKIKYRPQAMTLELFDTLKNLDMSTADIESLRAFLVPILDWWDLEDETGNNLSISDGIAIVPIPFLALCVQAIGSESLPNAQTGVTSVVSSLQEETQVASQNGTESSEQQTDSNVLPGNFSASTQPG